MSEELPERPRPFEFAQPTEAFTLAPPSRKGKRVALAITLGIGIPVLLGGAGAGYLLISSALADGRPPALSADQRSSIQAELSEHADLLAQLDDQRAAYNTAVSQWDQSLSWAEDAHGPADQPSVAVANPGGDALPGDDPYGRAFLDSIGATDVVVVFDAGPDNCGFYGNSGGGDSGYVYAGGCFRADHSNTLYMAWDSGAEDIVWPIFVHEAMHWYQDENYLQDEYLADFAGSQALKGLDPFGELEQQPLQILEGELFAYPVHAWLLGFRLRQL